MAALPLSAVGWKWSIFKKLDPLMVYVIPIALVSKQRRMLTAQVLLENG